VHSNISPRSSGSLGAKLPSDLLMFHDSHNYDSSRDSSPNPAATGVGVQTAIDIL
jgi:hypothetical protein